MHKLSMPNTRAKLPLFLIGMALVIFAAAVDNESYSRFLLGELQKDLSWGPSLFRGLLAFHGLLLIGLSFIIEDPIGQTGVQQQMVKAKMSGKTIAALISLSVFGLTLRLWNLNSDLWIDEVLTLLDFVRKPIGEILVSFPSQNQHMLFSLLSRLSIVTFGESALALRLPSVLFGIGSIWAFFFLCRRLLGLREALLGSALITVSYHHIWFSQNARGYMGLLLFTLLATWCWFEALEHNAWRWWLGYAAAIVFGMWVHPTMAFVVASHGIVHLLFLILPAWGGNSEFGPAPVRRASYRPFAAWMLSITVTLQLYALALPEFIAVGLHEESMNSEWTNPVWVVTESIRNLSVGFAGIAVVICGAAFVAFGWVSIFRINRQAAVLMVLPALLAGLTMVALGHNIWPRFFFFSMGFGLLIVIHGLTQLPRVLASYIRPLQADSRIAGTAGIVLTTLLIAASLTTLPRNYALPKQNYSGAKSYVETNAAPGDKVVAVRLAGVVYGNYLTPFWPVVKTESDLEALEGGSERVWLVYTLSPEVKAFRPNLWKMIESNYDVVQTFPGTLSGGEVFVCQKKINARG